MLEVAVITVSDRAFRGEYQDLSGPTIVELLNESPLEINASLIIVPDDEELIRKSIQNNLDKDYIFTTGGTGISSRDVTPEVTAKICEKELPGISEMLRFQSYVETKNAVFSRGYSGIRGKTIIVNFPGSVKAVTLCTRLMIPVMEHGKKMLADEKH